MRNHSLQSGFFLIEVVVASAVIATVLIYLLGAINDSVEISQRALERTQASYLLEESAEAVKAIRDQDFATINALTLGSTYYMQWNGSTWVLTATPQTVGIFTRSIVFQVSHEMGVVTL